ncbi:MAG: hypothetical protein CVT49_05755 [candidate division Zixibacteria bacterium HGW-Zixibacteria-1]|nr:MAG: hypothetical protein CVT49_05755 [candidate division Zixibacteria bacterium HGW-Zixibacteria-1]
MNRYFKVAFFVLIALSGAGPIHAQFRTADSPTFTEYLADAGGGKVEAYYADKPTDTTIKYQNPTTALFKSMFVPGLGQIGNRKYIKAGVIIALESSLIAGLVHYADKTSNAKDAFDAATDLTERTRLFQEYRIAKDDRNRFSWYTATVIFLSMFDAYVDAHLARFPKYDKNISVDMSSEKELSPVLQFTYRF